MQKDVGAVLLEEVKERANKKGNFVREIAFVVLCYSSFLFSKGFQPLDFKGILVFSLLIRCTPSLS